MAAKDYPLFLFKYNAPNVHINRKYDFFCSMLEI